MLLNPTSSSIKTDQSKLQAENWVFHLFSLWDVNISFMPDQLTRFTKKYVVLDNGCWQWIGTVHRHGYGRFYDYGNHFYPAHRWAYEHWVGPIPEGMQVDHICHDPSDCSGGYGCLHRRCVNPEHMEIVTVQENLARRSSVVVTHCPRGHEYAGDNLYITKTGSRQCVECNRVRARERQRRIRAMQKNNKTSKSALASLDK